MNRPNEEGKDIPLSERPNLPRILFHTVGDVEEGRVGLGVPILLASPRDSGVSGRRLNGKHGAVFTDRHEEDLYSNPDHLVGSDSEKNIVVMTIPSPQYFPILLSLLEKSIGRPTMGTCQTQSPIQMIKMRMYSKVKGDDEGSSFTWIEGSMS